MNYIKSCHAVTGAWFVLFACHLWLTNGMGQKQAEIEAIGSFMNVQSNGEHADGYSVELWSRAGDLIGFVDYHRGLIGDPPIGVLTDVKYSASTGALSFKAKLTSGLHSCREHTMVPSRDLLSFQGFLKVDQLQGRVFLENYNDASPAVMDSRENFSMKKNSAYPLQSYETYDAWWAQWEPVYKARGAKW